MAKKKEVKKKLINKYIKLVVVIFSISVVAALFYFLFNYGKDKLIYKIGAFTYLTNTQEVFSTSREGFNLKPRISVLGDPSCQVVSGVVDLILDKKLDNEKRSYNNNFSITSWNLNNLKFSDSSAMKSALESVEGVENLSNYTDKQKLLSLVFGKANGQGITLSPWLGLAVCGGRLSYPVHIQKIESDIFDIVLYAEALEGQDSYNNVAPVRFLVIKKNDDWFMLDERVKIDNEYYQDAAKLCTQKNGNDIVACVENIWSSKYRDESANQKWIGYSLQRIKYID